LKITPTDEILYNCGLKVCSIKYRRNCPEAKGYMNTFRGIYIMYMAIGLIAFLSAGFFVIKGLIDLFRRRKYKKSFLIALASFVIFVTTIVMDPSVSTEEANEEKLQDEVKEDKKTEDKKETDEDGKGVTDKEKSDGAAEKDEAAKEETKTDSSQTASEKKDNAGAPKMTNRGVDAKVTRVVDGDTIEVLMNGKIEDIRMLLLDTPETKHPSKPVEPFGPEASKFAKETLEGKTVGIEVGLEERDNYGRLLAYVWIGSKTYQERVLEKGLGVTAYLYNDLRMLEQFHKAQNIGRDKKIGVWSIPGYAHVDHNHGYHYEETKTATTQPAAKTVPSPVTKPATQPVQKPATQPAAKPAPEPVAKPAPKPAPAPTQPAQSFANCTELTKVYPNGVDSSHPAYQKKMDRDGDNFACER
jgi:micrococcal nuclease